MKSSFFLILLMFFLQTIAAGQSKTYVLVHGGWHGAWCWRKVVPLLQTKGNQVIAIDLPGHGEDTTPANTVTLDDYAKKIIGVVKGQKGPVILVGHSMAGVAIAQAAEILGAEKIEKLVFLDAFMPKNGESVLMMAARAAELNKVAGKPEPGISVGESMVISADQKTSTIKSDKIEQLFYNDCSSEDVAFAKAHLGPQPLACLGTPVAVTDARYGSIPKIYILCTLAKDLDKSSLAQNMPVQKLFKLASSHSPFFSMPQKLADILVEL